MFSPSAHLWPGVTLLSVTRVATPGPQCWEDKGHLIVFVVDRV